MTEIKKAIEILEQGGIGIFPTDTAYGLGCKIDDEYSVNKLYKIMKRPKDKATPVLFDSKLRVSNYLMSFDSNLEKLMEKYWPGALTIVYPCIKSKVPELVRGGGSNLGVRVPKNEIVNSLINGVNKPILGSSANFLGENTPFTYKALDKSLVKLVDFVIEGNTKGLEQSSTVINCSAHPWKIIRQGEIVPDL